MGSAASSSKNAVIPLNKSSASDGCQCHFYENKLKDMEKSVKDLEEQKGDLSLEVDRLNEILTELEGEKMDQSDTIASLENRLEIYMSEGAGDKCAETLKAKDQMIANLERQIGNNEAEFTKQRARWRRKLRHYATQLAEAKHSSAIRVMELRQEVTRLAEENEKLKKKRRERRAKAGHGSDADSSTDTDTDSAAAAAEAEATGKHGLVLELSQQMLEQTTKIKKLEHSLREREKQLAELQDAMAAAAVAHNGGAQRLAVRRGQRGVKTGAARQWSGYSHDSGLDSDVAPDSAGLASRQGSHVMSATAASLSPLSERDSSQTAAPPPPPAAGASSGDAADEALYREITEDKNWDAASLASSDTVGPSPRFMTSTVRPTSARRDSASRPALDRGRSIILDPDKEYTIDSVLELTTNA